MLSPIATSSRPSVPASTTRRTSPPRGSMRTMRPVASTMPVNIGISREESQPEIRAAGRLFNQRHRRRVGERGQGGKKRHRLRGVAEQFRREIEQELVGETGREKGAAEERAGLDLQLVDFAARELGKQCLEIEPPVGAIDAEPFDARETVVGR